MLGSHDSYTYLDAKSSFANAVSRFWRCQNKSILDQYNFGVRFFDIRVMREVDDNNKTTWRVCHGIAELTKVYSSLKSICVYFSNSLKGCKFRIWLEKGSDEDWEAFKTEITPLIDKYPALLNIYRKKDYECLLDRDGGFELVYLACPMEKFSNYSKGVYTNPIKDYAENNNPEITQEMIDDPTKLYFMDYVTGV